MNHSHGTRSSLADSWGTANYFLEDSASVSDTAQSDFEDEDDMVTPQPPKDTRTSYMMDRTPTKAHTARPALYNSQLPSSGLSGSKPKSPEPSLIMPSLGGPSHAFDGQSSQFKSRRSKKSGIISANDTTPSIHRATGRRASSKIERIPYSSSQRQHQKKTDLWYYIKLFYVKLLWPVLAYLLEIVVDVLAFVKPLLGFIMFILLLVGALHLASAYARNAFHAVMLPICNVPGSSYIIPFCKSPPPSGRQPDFEELVNVQSKFEEALTANKDSYILPTNMKKSEIAIRDLRTKVKYSHLPSRVELDVEFTYFIESANEAADQLTKYNSKIGYVMDRVISTNGWTLRVLQGIANEQVNVSVLSRLGYLNPFSTFHAPSETLEQKIFNQYVTHIVKVKEEILNLITVSKDLLALLNSLELSLDAIADVAMRDDAIITRDRDLLFAQLWTKLGGNRSSKLASDKSLQLLNDMVKYRTLALQHVAGTMMKLKDIAAGLDNLSNGIAAPEVFGSSGGMPLEWHIEVISKCVERLRNARGETLEMEKARYQRLREGLGISDTEQSTEIPTVTAYPKSRS